MPMRPQRYLQQSSQYEPEGIVLILPLEQTEASVLQGWGARPDNHAQQTYNGIPLKGHPGVDLLAAPNTPVLAAAEGRVVEISRDPAGLGFYIKVEHLWGESLYAQLGTILVESGQPVQQGDVLARTAALIDVPSHLHFAVRFLPYNRFDGWGGFSDPTPFLYVAELVQPDEETEASAVRLPELLVEPPNARRP